MGTPRVVRAHRTRCFVNCNHADAVALMGLSPNRVRFSFDKAMAHSHVAVTLTYIPH